MSYFKVKTLSPSTSSCGVVRVISKLAAVIAVSPTFVEPKKSDALGTRAKFSPAVKAIFDTCMAGSVFSVFTVILSISCSASPAQSVSVEAAATARPLKSIGCGVKRLTVASKPSAAMLLLASLNSTTVSEPSSAVERTRAVSPCCRVRIRLSAFTS